MCRIFLHASTACWGSSAASGRAAPLWGTYHNAGHEATTPLALGQAILAEARNLHPLPIAVKTAFAWLAESRVE